MVLPSHESWEASLTAGVIQDEGALQALLPEWRRLWERCAPAVPFTAPAWLMPWWRQFSPGPLFILWARRSGQLAAIAPSYLEHGPHGRRILPFGIPVSDRLDVLADPDLRVEALAGLLCAALSRRDAWDRWELEELAPAALAHLIPAPPEDHVDECVQQHRCPVLLFPEAAQELAEVLPRRKREHVQLALNRCRRRGAVEIERVSGPDLLPALEDLIRLHALRWGARGESGVLASEQVRAFHRSAIGGLDEAGLLRMYRLILARRVVGVYYGFLIGAQASFYLAGFDPEYQFESPGTVLIAHAIGEAIREGCREFDFLRGPEPYKYSWGTVDRWTWKRSIARRR